jgi:galactokinase
MLLKEYEVVVPPNDITIIRNLKKKRETGWKTKSGGGGGCTQKTGW